MKYFLPCRRSNIPGVPYQLTPALLRFRPKGFQVDYSLSWILSPGNRFCGRPSPRVLATPLSSLKRKHTQRIRYSRRWTRCLIKLPINRISIFLQNNSLEGQKREGKRQRNYRKVNRSITNNFPHDVFNQRTFFNNFNSFSCEMRVSILNNTSSNIFSSYIKKDCLSDAFILTA